jgi:hypothetical protein
MKRSEVIAIEFSPWTRRIWITRHWNSGGRTAKGYPLTHRRVGALWKLAGTWIWEQHNGVTTLRA